MLKCGHYQRMVKVHQINIFCHLQRVRLKAILIPTIHRLSATYSLKLAQISPTLIWPYLAPKFSGGGVDCGGVGADGDVDKRGVGGRRGGGGGGCDEGPHS